MWRAKFHRERGQGTKVREEGREGLYGAEDFRGFWKWSLIREDARR